PELTSVEAVHKMGGPGRDTGRKTMTRSSRTALCLLVFCLFFLTALAAPAQQVPPPAKEPVDVPRIEGKVSVDGRLDEPAWQQALLLDLPVETQPGENIPA